MRAAVLVACLAAAPALAQFKVPDNLPPLPDGGAACNEKRTHCVVNFADWMASEIALKIAAQRLANDEDTIAGLRAALARERASKVVRCATITPEARTARK